MLGSPVQVLKPCCRKGRRSHVAPSRAGRDIEPGPSTRARPAIDRLPMTASEATQHSYLVRIAAGDANAVDECLKRYAAMVWSLVGKAWKDHATIEDLVQEIFIEVWKSAGRFDPERASEATFIATIARRRIIDRRRRIGRAVDSEELEDHDVGYEDAGPSRVELGDEAARARAALAELKPDQRRVILMSVVDGLTHNEIATATGMPLGTVKSHIRRGLKETAQRLRGGTE